MSKQKEWFEIWFDSPYYHLLYKHRDEKEAVFFLDNIIREIHLKDSCKILDLACGKGRHCIYLNKKGFDVTGVDISEESINYVKKFANPNLEFYLHDMRKPFRINYYDAILNLFSSFGYFKTEKENTDVIHSVAAGLKKNGFFILDYMNSKNAEKKIVPQETKIIDGLNYKIKRKKEGKSLIKEIEISDKAETYLFREILKLYSQEDISKYLQNFNLNLINLYGDYSLNKFNEEKSERMIFVAQKK